MQWYILDANRTPIPVSDTEYFSWKQSLDFADAAVNGNYRRVDKTELANSWVSTVFLGLDHSLCDGSPPELFETMVFAGDGWDDQYCTRCATWDEAVAMHERGVAWARKNLEDIPSDFDIYE